MKIKDEYVLERIADKWVVVSANAGSLNFNKIISFNDTAAFLWQRIEDGNQRDELIKSLMEEYDIDITKAKEDVDKFIDELNSLEVFV